MSCTLRDSDIAEVPNLFTQITDKVSHILVDGGYSINRVNQFAAKHDNLKYAQAVGPPKPDEDCRLYKERLLVESTFSRYKRILGNKLKAQIFSSQKNEAMLSLEILNKMKSLGMPCYEKF